MSTTTKSLMVMAVLMIFVSGCATAPATGRVVTSFTGAAAPGSTLAVAQTLSHGLVPYGIEIDRVRDKLGIITLKTRYLSGASEAVKPGDRRRMEKVHGVSLDTSIILHRGGMDILFTMRGDYRNEDGVVHEDIHQQMLHLARIISQLSGFTGDVLLTPAKAVVAETPEAG